MMKKYTKIIATIGPASDSEQTLRKLYDAGMDIARLNFSHGSYEYFEKIIKNIRKVSDKIAILLDTKGPEIRSGEIKDGEILLEDGQNLIFTKKVIIGDVNKVTMNYVHIGKLKVGNSVLIDDGLIETTVTKIISNEEIEVKVVNGGKLGSKKTISVRGHNVEIPFLSKKDEEDILFGIAQNIDFIAASFVREKSELDDLKVFLNKNGGDGIKIISKIEHGLAVEHIDEIISASDSLMVARGDLGVEMPLEKVPKIQEEIISKCRKLGKPVIVATQMLESMKDNPRPTRAEVSDVANAILQGTDAIMLSGETAGGKYPVKAVEMMTKIANECDFSKKPEIIKSNSEMLESKNPISVFITKGAYLAAEQLNSDAILVTTKTGYSARKVSRFKPNCPIYAITEDIQVLRQLQLSWGVIPMIDGEKTHQNHDEMVNSLVQKCFDKGYLKENSKIVVTSGHIMSEKGHTNVLEIYGVHTILKRIVELKN